MKIKDKIFGLMFLLVALFSASYSYQSYIKQKNLLIKGIDEKLYTAAMMARATLPPDYHDTIVDKNSVPPQKYLTMIDHYNALCVELELQYLWSLMIINEKIVFTSSTSKDKKVENGEHALFFDVHTNPHAYEKAFREMKPDYRDNEDKWGKIRVVLLPFYDSQGRKYLFGASMKLHEVNALLKNNIEESTSMGLLFLCIGLLFSYVFANFLSKPFNELVRETREIASGQLDKEMAAKGSYEQRALVQSFNSMCQAIKTKIAEVTQSEENLSTTLNSIGDAVISTDTEGRVVRMNPVAETLTGWTIKEAQHKPLDDVFRIVNAKTRESAVNPVRSVLESGEIVGLANHTVLISQEGKEYQISDSAAPIRDSQGDISGVVLVFRDVTVEYCLREALEKRLVALTRPLSDTESVTIEELFNLNDIQKLQDDFAQATGVASIITDVDGKPITKASNFCRLCSDIIRKTEKGCANCQVSDAELGRLNLDGPIVKQCLSGGLWDAGAAITVGGKHIANWLIGQVRDETQTEENMRQYAREIEANEDDVVRAFYEVPAMSRERFKEIAQVLFTLANQLSATAYQNVQQARFIYERKHAEESLLDEKAFTETVLNSQPDTFFLFNPTEGRALRWNRAFCLISGYSDAEIAEMKAPDAYYSSSDLKRIAQFIDEVLENGSGTIEAGLICKDGHVVPTEYNVSLLASATAEEQYIIAIGRDMTERKKVEGELERSEERFQLAMEASSDGLWDWSIKTDEVYYSPGYIEMLGYELHEFPAHVDSWLQHLHVEDKELALMANMDCIENRADSFETEFRMRKKDGDWIWVLGRGKAVARDESGKATRMVGTHADITARKRAEEALRQSEGKFRELFEKSGDAILIIENGVFVDCNPATVSLLEYDSKDEFLHVHPSVLSPETQPDGQPSREKANEMIRLVIERGSHRFEWDHKKKNGEIVPVEVLLTTIPKEGNRVLIHTVWRDITERRKKEQQVHSALIEKETLLRELYHRTKNNMQVISGMLTLQSKYSDSVAIKTMFTEMVQRIEAMTLVHQKLYQSKNLSRIDLKEYIADLAKQILKAYAIEENKLSLEHELDELSVVIDVAIPCGLIINELLSNVFKHAFPSASEGSVTIEAHALKKDEIELVVRDTGVGLTEEFDIAKCKTMGLRTVRMIVEHQLGGRISLKTERGVEWRIVFPNVLYQARV